MLPTFNSSPLAMQEKVEDRRIKYPWATMSVGKSFIVPTASVKFKSIELHAYRMGKKLGKSFRVINHGAEVGYEVACVGIIEPASINHVIGWDKVKEGS